VTRRLYTEDDVRRLAPGSELCLGAEALATPSALDLARERGIRVRWSDGASAGGSAAADPAARLAELLGGEGAFWVQVEGGRARAWRQGPDGPVEVPLDGPRG
jgi:hypothetical protein